MKITKLAVSLLLAVLITLSGCTISCVNTMASGRSSDTVDTEADASADVKPNINIPIPGL